MSKDSPLSPEVGEGGGVEAMMLCLSQYVSRIPAEKRLRLVPNSSSDARVAFTICHL